MLGRPVSEWVAQYATSHQHPVNRMCHSFGIPMIVVFEGQPPEFFKDWRFHFVGLRCWVAKISGKA